MIASWNRRLSGIHRWDNARDHRTDPPYAHNYRSRSENVTFGLLDGGDPLHGTRPAARSPRTT